MFCYGLVPPTVTLIVSGTLPEYVFAPFILVTATDNVSSAIIRNLLLLLERLGLCSPHAARTVLSILEQYAFEWLW